MNLSKAVQLLEKINALSNSLDKSGLSIASIERDLMLSYIRQLYECYMDEKPISAISSEPRSLSNTVVQKEERSNYKPPRIIEIPNALKEEDKSAPAPEPIENKTTAPQPVTPSVATPKVEPEKAVAVLFEQKAAADLSEKLSTSPINDLTKAIALNDKLLYSNQLFEGALVTFNEVIRRLNGMSYFQEAESYLIELATKHNWAAEQNQEVAKTFIKLVRRRFL